VKELHCPVCKYTNGLIKEPYLDTFWPDLEIFKGLFIEYCPECGFGFSFPEIGGTDIENFYVQTYRSQSSPFYINFSTLHVPILYDLRAMAQLILAKHFVGFTERDIFVDVGPGPGTSFSSAKKLLNNPEMLAVELNSGAASAYHKVYGVKTFKKIEEVTAQGLKAKIILSSHSLEHFKLSDLKEFLLNIKNNLASDGIFVAEVPHVDMRLHSNHRKNDAPHFLFFSKDSLSKLLYESGFDVLFIDTCDETYSEWWLKSELHESIPGAMPMKQYLKSLLGYLPFKSYLKKLYMKIKGNVIDFNDSKFLYGGNRTCLRIVVRPKI